MTKTSISQYFNPEQHLVIHQDKEGNMIGGGYQVNNLLYEHKMPLFVSLDDAGHQMGGGSGCEGGDKHFIPEKFSDLFRDLAVPAGLFMMPALFRPRNYAFEVPEPDKSETEGKHKDDTDTDTDTNTDTDTDTDSEHDDHKRKPVPSDIFDTLLSLVTPSERMQHDVKTRKNHHKEKKRQNKTKRARA